LNDVEFELYDHVDNRGNVVKQKYSGAWVIVDNGYLNWATTVPPMKASCKRPEIRFSQWLEAIRKDVECTFGIMKGRFRILKTGIRLHGQQPADKIFRTCCALHNWLLNVDGLDKQWENGVPSIWEGELGHHDLSDVNRHIPHPLRRILSRTELVRYVFTTSH
jgi:Plant transposon protein